jgi:hypothetical protein
MAQPISYGTVFPISRNQSFHRPGEGAPPGNDCRRATARIEIMRPLPVIAVDVRVGVLGLGDE